MTRFVALFSGTLVLACSGSRETANVALPLDSAAVTRARAAADELGGDLVTMLTTELQRGGPAGAIAVCADSAQVRTERHHSSGITVRRVGTRVRNPKNAPDSTEAAVLAAFAGAIAANRPIADTAFTIRDAAGNAVTRYMRVIKVQEFCTACHGPADTISDAVKQIIASRYPEDRATGYRTGDLRGAISVTVKMP
jgi:hypothetical protein